MCSIHNLYVCLYVAELLLPPSRNLVDVPSRVPSPNTALSRPIHVTSRALLSYEHQQPPSSSMDSSSQRALVPVSTALTQYMEKTISRWKGEVKEGVQRDSSLGLPSACVCPQQNTVNLTHMKG